MEQKPIEVCLADGYLCNRIKYLGYKISKRRPNTYSCEDGEQELWEAIIKRLPRYTGQTSLTDFAGAAAYSRYGHIISEHGNKAEDLYESAYRNDDLSNIPAKNQQEKIDTRITLDKIESDLRSESWRSKQFKLALSSIQFLRQGYTRTETAEKIGVSTQQLKYVMARIRDRVQETL